MRSLRILCFAGVLSGAHLGGTFSRCGGPTFGWQVAFADEGARPAASEDAKTQARALYVAGVKSLQNGQWSEGLASFEASSKLFPNPATTLNMGACERALGRYIRARTTFLRALSESARAAPGGALPESSVTEAKGFVAEIDRILAKVTVTVEPVEAAIAVDGRPLELQKPAGDGGLPVVAAGVLAPGPGVAPPAATFDLLLDPGAHVITLTRKGFADAVVNKTFAPGSTSTLELRLDLLPATLKVSSAEPGALVRVNDADVGPVPVDVLRPAGSYRVAVNKEGFVPYGVQVVVKPGEEVKLDAPLAVDKPSIAKRWWFWTAIAAVIGTGVVVTYVATRPKPAAPPYQTGTANWLVPAAIHFK